MTAIVDKGVALDTAAQVDGGGTMWRLRSLVAMGHDAIRIAHALRVHSHTIEKILRGGADAVPRELCELARQLWDAWWDKCPPEETSSERMTAACARHLAERFGWPPPLGLDEDELDEPGYRPYSRYRAAAGTGTAGEFHPQLELKPAQSSVASEERVGR